MFIYGKWANDVWTDSHTFAVNPEYASIVNILNNIRS
jgi:hypothetical protein